MRKYSRLLFLPGGQESQQLYNTFGLKHIQCILLTIQKYKLLCAGIVQIELIEINIFNLILFKTVKNFKVKRKARREIEPY